ncbi:hypothetical protein JNB63_10925 [Microbacterium trichothecenolyticum]|jgi:hypothetical protein|uniref:Four-helix bundle copper-binding protein n=1 Tax=Microbacterium ureisolvens TaxID=2781186 RepID=A0ABS7HVK8_9MICO|nr:MULTISPECIES: hypothetical protein [Microbacterium]MBW9108874.1 hypothetical protein [Microbacterium ureisolvens]MBW9120610.1 hypothetical protein [Microbacterium trichothecenolyticum]
MDQMMMGAMSKDMMSMPGMQAMDMSVMQACMDACSACEQACTVCSTQMMDCAPACMNCADMCNTMMRSMMRMQGMDSASMMAMLDACIAMCQKCMDDCMRHADMSEVCKMCAQSCQACMDACMAMKNMMMAMS